MNHERLVADRALDEVVHRAFADLQRPVDVERPNARRRQAELLVVAQGQVLGRELRHGVGPPGLTDRAQTRHVALGDLVGVAPKDLARAEVQEPLAAPAREGGLERVVGADERDLHRQHGVLEHRIHAGDRRHVHDDVRVGGSGHQRLCVHDIPAHEPDVRVVEQGRCLDGVSVQVVEERDAVLLAEPCGERRADKAGAAGHEDMGVLDHGASSISGAASTTTPWVRSARGTSFEPSLAK